MSTQFVAIVKLEYLPLTGTADEEVFPSNIPALQIGLQALAKQRAEDFQRSTQLWAEAVALLAQESEDEIGPAGEGAVQINDEFAIGDIAGVGPDSPCYW